MPDEKRSLGIYWIQIVVLVIIYVLLGNIKSISANPFVPGAVIAVNMIVVVIAGVLFGKGVGFSVGLIGTTFNALSPAGNAFEFAAILPHAIMGYSAGALRENKAFASLSIILGHLLNILVFLVFGLLKSSALGEKTFWTGLGSEAVMGYVSILLIVWLYGAFVRKK